MSLLKQAIRQFEKEHDEDPRAYKDSENREVPYSVFYHQRLGFWVRHLSRAPSEELLLAASCQHLCRWKIPRGSFPMTRSGYKAWRRRLSQFHADRASEILSSVGYDQTVINRVRELLLKRDYKSDPEVQLFEDAICLVFLENEFESFSSQHDRDKLNRILRKTWKKMSPAGHAAASGLLERLPEPASQLIQNALSDQQSDRSQDPS